MSRVKLTSENSGIITSILRFIAFYNKSSFTDATYNATTLILWTVCEPGVYLIAACLLVYRPLLDKLGIPMITNKSSRGNSDGPSGLFARRKPAQAEVSADMEGITLRTIGGTPYDRKTVGGKFEQLNSSDERLFGKYGGITARTDIEVAWEAGAV